MEIYKVKEKSIKLGQLLKVCGLADTGADAKYAIINGEVSINGEVEYQRGKKLKDGDIVSYKENEIKIEE